MVERGGRGTMKRMLGVAMLLSVAAIIPAQEAAAQDPIAGAIVGGRGRRHNRWCGRARRGWRGCRRRDRRDYGRGDRIRGAAAARWLLLVARRLLLPLSERLLAAGTAGLLLVSVS